MMGSSATRLGTRRRSATMDQDVGKVKKVKNKSLPDTCGNLAGFWWPEVCEATRCWPACGVVVKGK